MSDYKKSETLQNLLRAMDSEGRVSFSSKGYYYLTQDEGESKKRFFQRMCLSFLYEFHLFTLLPGKYKTHADKMDVKWQAIEGTPDFEISFDAAKLLFLPGQDIRSEAQEVDDFVESWKGFFITFARKFPGIRIFNERTKNRKTYGKLVFDLRDEDANDQTKAYEDEAARRIDESPVLTHWITQMALALNKLGPYSWGHFRSELVFGRAKDPVMLAIMEDMENEKKKPAPTVPPKRVKSLRLAKQHR